MPKLGRPRQNASAAAATDPRITDRRQLADLRRIVLELHETRGYSFRQIAKYTSRGANTHGYWQMVAAGAHQTKPPRIRPTQQDLREIKQLAQTVRAYAMRDAELLGAVLEVVKRQAELVQAVGDCMAIVQRRTRKE